MNIRELLKRDHGIDVRISAGTGRREAPYVIERCNAEEAALTQVQLLRGIGRGLGELWRIIEWTPYGVGKATEIIRIEAVRFTRTEVETMTRGVYFDTNAVFGAPRALHPLLSWRGPAGSPSLPYELGWLHFDKAIDNVSAEGPFDQTILYSGAGAKVSVYFYARPSNGGKVIRNAELERAARAVFNPNLEDPWPITEVGPFAMKFFLSGEEMTAVGVAVYGLYFVKVRLTCFDDPKMRQLMSATLNALAAYVQR
jgi:hypothetical protein